MLLFSLFVTGLVTSPSQRQGTLGPGLWYPFCGRKRPKKLDSELYSRSNLISPTWRDELNMTAYAPPKEDFSG